MDTNNRSVDQSDPGVTASALMASRPASLALPITPLRATLRILLLLFLMSFSGFFAVIFYSLYLGITYPGMDQQAVAGRLQSALFSLNGLTLFALFQYLVVLPCLRSMATFPGMHWVQTLAINPVSASAAAKWIGLLGVFLVGESLYSHYLQIPAQEFMQLMSGNWHLGFAMIIVVMAPLTEEAIFRGYAFKAWRHTWLGFIGTLLLTSALFALMHAFQYTVIVLVPLFAMGILLGCAREYTGSLLMPIILHALNNLVAVVMVMGFGMP